MLQRVLKIVLDYKRFYATLPRSSECLWGRKIRCRVQQGLFEQAQQQVVESDAGSLGIATMDFKMKFQPRMFREKTTDWYSQKDLSWHGSVITYRNDVPEGRDEQKVYLKNLYIDHVCGNSTEQTAYSVCCILELVCKRVSILLTQLKYFIIEYDNAEQYANNLFPVLDPMICKR